MSNGTITWVDLSVPDVEAVHPFYADLLGWTLRVQESPMGSYTVCYSGEREVAGMMAQSPEMAGAPAVWTAFVSVDDLAATLDAVARAGGLVLQAPFEIPGGAHVAVIADVSGAMLALISGGPEPETPYFLEEPGAVCWAELMTGDVDASMAFYRDVFGWTAETADTGSKPYVVFSRDGLNVAGAIGRTENVPAEAPDSWSVYFAVADCTATATRAAEMGGSILLDATPTPMGPFAVLADPAGAVFQIMEMVY